MDKVNSQSPVEFSDDLVTEKRVRDISTEIFDKLKTASVQIIPAEVTGVIYNEKDVIKNSVDDRHIGCVQVSCFPGFEVPGDWIFPLEGNIKKYPVFGELVAIICIGDTAYYFSPVNIRRAVNNNSVIGITNKDGKQLEKTSNFNGFKPEHGRPTRQIAGDIVIDGRDRQSIKLGKNDAPQKNSGSVIKIRIANKDINSARANFPIIENIQDDAASIYMTEKEEVNLTPAKIVNDIITPSKHSGKQIIIDSNKLVFNTKEGENNNIGVYAGHNLNLISKNDTNIVGKRVYLGAPEENVGIQPAVLGDALVDLLFYMAQALESAGTDLQSGTGISPLAGAPSIDPLKQKAGASMMALFGSTGKFSRENLKEALLSKHVYVSKQGR
tara:strand:- start:246 stop:1397 length:1152 start_codon:yes stop_codon:yes gene_type:complete